MAWPEILREIVVKISKDENNKKKIKGTGFFVSKNEIVTCYHVLADKNGQLSECYFVKNDAPGDWIEVEPLTEKCNALQDIAVLYCPFPINVGFRKIPFAPWDEKAKEFRSRGYDCNTTDIEGASTVEGEDCKIIDYTARNGEPRLQLKSIKKTLLPGRSGSPVWSVSQKAIVGMIDYQAGDESILKEKSMAILIENLPIDLSHPKGEPINVPRLPVDFLPRPDDLKRLRELVLSPGESKSAITGKASNVGNGCVSSIGLQGMGGIGKSVLAAALARDEQVLEAFPDGVIWIALGQRPDLPSKQLGLLSFLDKDHRAIKDKEDGLWCLRLLLRDRSCLIILDDVWTMDHVRAFDALGQKGKLLITTRNLEIVRGLKAREFCLDVLGEEESLQLLSISSGLKLEDLGPKAKKVAEECDRLPLALAMVGSMAKAALAKGRAEPWEHILHRLTSADLEKIKAGFPDYPYPNLLRAIDVSVESLEPEEQRHYLDLAVFPEDTEVPEAALALLWNKDEYDTQELADHLADRSLARFNAGRLSLHDLQHDFAVKRAGDLKALHGTFLNAYRKICQDGWHTGPNDGYFFQHLAYHLMEADKPEDLRKLLLDYDWMQAKLRATDVPSLLSDYDLMSSQEDLNLIQGAIRLSAHVLFRDPRQLPGQLKGRLRRMQMPSIQSLLEQIPLKTSYMWLCPLTESMMQPGGALIRTLQGHTAPVRAVALSLDARNALSGSEDKTLKLWDLETGQVLRTMRGHTGPVMAVAMTSDGRRGLSGSKDKTLKLWDLETGQVLRTMSHTDHVMAVALTPEGHLALSGSWDGTLKLWDLETGLVLRTMQSDPIKAVALTQDGRQALSGSVDNTLKFWNLETGEVLRTLQGHTNWVMAVVVSPDGRRALSGSDDETLMLWDLETGQVLQSMEGHSEPVRAVALTRDGRRALSGSGDSTLILWDLESGKKLRILQGHTNWIMAAGLTLDCRQALSGSWDGTLKLWDLEIGQEPRTVQGHTDPISAVALMPDCCRVLSGSYDNTLTLWNLENGKEIRKMQSRTGWVRALALTPDCLQALSGSDDNTLKLWDLGTGQVLRTMQGHTGPVRAVALTLDCLQALSGSDDNTLKLWDLGTGQVLRTMHGHTGPVRAAALTPDRFRALSGSDDKTLKLWDLVTGMEIRTMQGHTGRVRAVAFSPDGHRALSGSDDNTIKLWDLETGMEIRTMRGHTGWVRAVAFSPDGRRALSGSWDNTIKLWDPETGKILVEFSVDGPIHAIALSANKWTMAACEVSGRVHFLTLENPDM